MCKLVSLEYIDSQIKTHDSNEQTHEDDTDDLFKFVFWTRQASFGQLGFHHENTTI